MGVMESVWLLSKSTFAMETQWLIWTCNGCYECHKLLFEVTVYYGVIGCQRKLPVALEDFVAMKLDVAMRIQWLFWNVNGCKIGHLFLWKVKCCIGKVLDVKKVV
jgi:hypothetical protein